LQEFGAIALKQIEYVFGIAWIDRMDQSEVRASLPTSDWSR
jgi:hypothetical protein